MINEEEDLFQRYGSGIVTYFKKLESLMCIMLFFSVLVIPAMFLYSNHGAFFKEADSLYSSMARISLGNFGESVNLVAHDYLHSELYHGT